MDSRLLFIATLLLAGVLGTACSEHREVDEQCDNGTDDDGDGHVDCIDPDCDGDPACEETAEVCDNGLDDDGDGQTDCDDPDCGGDPACPGTEDCDNGVDDDDDDDVDCEDDDCDGHSSCTNDEDCDNGEDDDGDGDVDCDDDDCGGDPACPGTEDCTNNADDDGDGQVDCDDIDCEGHIACGEDEICNNSIDDDGDGEVDCDDPDCGGDPACPGSEDCTNGADDDGDGLIDCADDDCLGHSYCVEVCNNGVDDDLDGDTDCADSDCTGDLACVEVCDNGEDDDFDGQVDCGDDDCGDDPACLENCLNGVDDDGDGLVDCMDPACDFDLACAELCNGVDDDGDGRIDEFPIDPRIGTDCYDGPADAAGIGQCVMGVAECFGGEIQCLGWVAPLEDELCDGLDNDCDGVVPDDELDEGCGTTVTPGELTRIELETEVRDVDVHINLDTTGSMSGELLELAESLSSEIVPGVRDVLPTAAFGVSTFDDFPFGGFGSGVVGDVPFMLHQRITTSSSLVQDAIDAISLHNGADRAESGVESLYQIATGEGVTWVTEWSPEDCDDWYGLDEDGDGLVDCDDLDCVANPACWRWPDEDCSNGDDDDSDGYVDCDDPNCAYWPDPDCEGTYSNGPCGNGAVNTGEQCDDGNTEAGDGCDDSCQMEMGCGNGFQGDTEGCDDGNIDDGDGCSSECEVEPSGVCGNGDFDAGEQCDDGNTDDGDGCDATCLIEADCGDGVLSAGEDCDDGNIEDDDGCAGDCTSGREGIPAFDWTLGFDSGLGHGSVGGVGFRETAIPMIVHITDAPSHDASDYDSYAVDAHDALSTSGALSSIGALIVGVRTSDDIRADDPLDFLYPLGMAMATDAIVPLCAFDGSPARLDGVCADDECCTGIDGAGVAPVAADLCPMVFDTTDAGTGLGESVVTGIEALSRYVTYALSAVPRDDPVDAIDATCFVESIGITASSGPSGDCTVEPVGQDTDGDGVIDTLANATPRTRATFELAAVNVDVNDVDGDGNTTEACAGSGRYSLFLDVMADGRTVVATQRIVVEVP